MLERTALAIIAVALNVGFSSGCTALGPDPDDRPRTNEPPGHALAPHAVAALSRSALEAEVRSTDPQAIAAFVADARRKVAARAAREPDADAAAVLVFSSGIRPRALAELTAKSGVEIASVELKVPNTDPGRVFTISIGAKDILSRPGTTTERLERAIGRIRAEFYQLSQVEQDASEKARLEAVAFSPSVIVFKANLVGRVAALAALGADASLVSAIVMEQGTEMASSYRLFKSHQDLAVANVPPPSGVTERAVIKRVVLPRGAGPPPP